MMLRNAAPTDRSGGGGGKRPPVGKGRAAPIDVQDPGRAGDKGSKGMKAGTRAGAGGTKGKQVTGGGGATVKDGARGGKGQSASPGKNKKKSTDTNKYASPIGKRGSGVGDEAPIDTSTDLMESAMLAIEAAGVTPTTRARAAAIAASIVSEKPKGSTEGSKGGSGGGARKKGSGNKGIVTALFSDPVSADETKDVPLSPTTRSSTKLASLLSSPMSPNTRANAARLGAAVGGRDTDDDEKRAAVADDRKRAAAQKKAAAFDKAAAAVAKAALEDDRRETAAKAALERDRRREAAKAAVANDRKRAVAKDDRKLASKAAVADDRKRAAAEDNQKLAGAAAKRDLHHSATKDDDRKRQATSSQYNKSKKARHAQQLLDKDVQGDDDDEDDVAHGNQITKVGESFLMDTTIREAIYSSQKFVQLETDLKFSNNESSICRRMINKLKIKEDEEEDWWECTRKHVHVHVNRLRNNSIKCLKLRFQGKTNQICDCIKCYCHKHLTQSNLTQITWLQDPLTEKQ